MITKTSAQFNGYYRLRDGGVDMPSSTLIVFTNHQFMFVYFGGYKTGSWKEIDENNILLTETKTDNYPIKIIENKKQKSTNLKIDAYGLIKADAQISFSKDTLSQPEFQPIFNDNPNCFDDDYFLIKQPNAYKWLTIALPAPSNFMLNGKKYPYKAIAYTFSLKNVSGCYSILYNQEFLPNPVQFSVNKKGNKYYVNESEKALEREDLTEELLENINKLKKDIEQENFSTSLLKSLPIISTKEIIIYKPKLKPLFTAKCPDDKEFLENTENPKPLISADRVDGIYTVLNYKAYAQNDEFLQLEKEPSITKLDILSFNKVVSDYGGYEIEMIFTESGSIKFATLTKNNIGKPLAIVFNKLILSAPIINTEIKGGKALISGNLTEKQIDELVVLFKK